MRLYPPAWMVDRVALADDEFQGLRYSARHAVFALLPRPAPRCQVLGRARGVPARAASAPTRPARLPANAYVPFGGGPRLCIGMQFALTEMHLVTLELLRQFDIEWVPGQPPVAMEPLVTLRPKHDFRVRLRSRVSGS